MPTEREREMPMERGFERSSVERGAVWRGRTGADSTRGRKAVTGVQHPSEGRDASHRGQRGRKQMALK